MVKRIVETKTGFCPYLNKEHDAYITWIYSFNNGEIHLTFEEKECDYLRKCRNIENCPLLSNIPEFICY